MFRSFNQNVQQQQWSHGAVSCPQPAPFVSADRGRRPGQLHPVSMASSLRPSDWTRLTDEAFKGDLSELGALPTLPTYFLLAFCTLALCPLDNFWFRLEEPVQVRRPGGGRVAFSAGRARGHPGHGAGRSGYRWLRAARCVPDRPRRRAHPPSPGRPLVCAPHMLPTFTHPRRPRSSW